VGPSVKKRFIINLFNKIKPVNIFYDIYLDGYENKIPKGFFNNVKNFKLKSQFGCPAVSTIKNRVFFIPAPCDLEIKIKKENNNFSYYFEFKNAPKNIDLINFLNECFDLSVVNNNLIFQFNLPYNFYSNSKNTEILTMPPPNKFKNLKFVSGAFNINLWIRPINSSWVVLNKEKPASLKFEKDEPLALLVFNKNAFVKYKPFNLKTLDFFLNIFGIAKFKNNSFDYSKYIIKRKPKKF